jgi:hypothetical protein
MYLATIEVCERRTRPHIDVEETLTDVRVVPRVGFWFAVS